MIADSSRLSPKVWLTPEILEYFRVTYGNDAFVASLSKGGGAEELSAARARLDVYLKLRAQAPWAEDKNFDHTATIPAAPAADASPAPTGGKRHRAGSEASVVLDLGEA